AGEHCTLGRFVPALRAAIVRVVEREAPGAVETVPLRALQQRTRIRTVLFAEGHRPRSVRELTRRCAPDARPKAPASSPSGSRGTRRSRAPATCRVARCGA